MSTSGFLSLGAPPLVATGEPLEPAASSFELPGEYDVTGAFNFLVNEKNLSRKDATFEVARDVSRRAGIPESAFRAAIEEGGFTPEQIISRFTGARDPGMIAAAAEGAVREGIRAAPAFAAATAGAKAGFRVPGPLPVKLGAAGVGGVGGFLAGLLAGETAQDLLVTPVTGEGQILPSQQPAFEAGRTVGATLAGIPTALGAMRALPEAINLGSAKILTNVADYSGRKGAARMALGKGLAGAERVIPEIGKRARTKTGAAAIAAGEVGAAGYMGLAGGVSEQVAPGEAVPRVLAETAVGTFLPHRVVLGALPMLKDAGQRLTRSGREDMAADYLNRFFDTVAEAQVGPRPEGMSIADYEDQVAAKAAGTLDNLIKELRVGNLVDAEGKPLKLTPGQVLNSPELLAMERQLFKSELGSAAKSRSQQASQDGLAKLAVVMKKLTESGDPRAIYAAAKMEESAINDLLRANLDAKAANAVETIGRISQRLGSQATREGEVRIGAEESRKLGDVLTTAVQQSLREWREVERQAYANVNLDEQVSPDAILSKFRDLTTEFGYPGAKMPKEITDMIVAIAGKDAVDPLSKKTKDALSLAESDVRFSRNRASDMEAKLSAEEKAVMEGLLRGDREATAGLPEMRPARRQRIQDAAAARKAFSQYENRLADVREQAQREAAVPFDPRAMTLREIKNFRSAMLRLARDSQRVNETDRLIFGRMAEAALDDLGVSAKRVEQMLEEGLEPSENQRQLLRAYAISREGNDVFTRSFAKDLTAKERTGAERIPPELALEELMKGSSNRTVMKINDVREAVKYLPGGEATLESAANAAQRLNDFENTLDKFLAGRLVDPYDGVLKTITPRDPATGRDLAPIEVIDPVKLRRFRRDYQDVLNMDAMKALNRDLADAEKASNLAISAKDQTSQRYKNFQKNMAFGRVLGQADPLRVVSEALTGRVAGEFNPEKSFKAVIRTVNRVKDPDTLQASRDGLRNNVLDWAFQEALKNDGTLDLKKYKDALFKPVTQGQSSPMQMLIDGNIVSPEFNQKLRANLANVEKLQSAVDQGLEIDEILSGSNPTLSFLARFAGARVGASMGTGTIQVPGYFAREAQALFDTAPSMAMRDILVSASEPRAGGYDEMEKLLGLAQQRRADGKQATNLLAKFLGSVFGTGAVATPALRAAAEASIPISQEERPMPIQPAPRPTAQAPMAPPPAPRPVAQAAPPPMPAPAPAAPQADTRARYAALYPFESTSQMIRATSPASGGIGSLMG